MLIPHVSSVTTRRVLGIILSGVVAFSVVGVGLSPTTYARTLRLKKPGPATGVTAQPIGQGGDEFPGVLRHRTADPR